jgi:hypothetical protein
MHTTYAIDTYIETNETRAFGIMMVVFQGYDIPGICTSKPQLRVWNTQASMSDIYLIYA